MPHDDDDTLQCHILRHGEAGRGQAKTKSGDGKTRFEHGKLFQNDFHRLLRRAHDRLTTADTVNPHVVKAERLTSPPLED
jgi:hypothetical protein